MIKEKALRYLGYHTQDIPPNIHQLINECMEEIETIASFKHVYQLYDLQQEPLTIVNTTIQIAYPALIQLLEDCHSCIIEACTLGHEVDRKLQYYRAIDVTKMTIFDAVASSYLEYACDQEENIFPSPHTYRFCPGYGDVPITINHNIANTLQIYKNIGVTVQENGLLLPQKSMIGIVGIGQSTAKKNCSTCIKKNDCMYIRRGKVCY